MPVRIVTDSACDLPEPICEELGIEVVPLTIRFGDREYVDRKELSVEAFWRELAASSVLPETAAPSVGAFEETFRRLSDDGADGIVCINLSARLSATMQSAQVAAKALDGETADPDHRLVQRVDGHRKPRPPRGPRARATAPPSTTSSRDVEARRQRGHVFAALDTLEYLRKGGRIGGAQAMLGSMLSIKPIISVHRRWRRVRRARAHPFQGVEVPGRPDSGRQGRLDRRACTETRPMSTSSSPCCEPVVPDAEVMVGMIGPVIGVHTGPRVMGIAWTDRQE